MINFSFSGLFKTTTKGIPNIKIFPASISLSKIFFVYSIILQSIIFLIFLLYLALSIFRIIKKIKNNKFREVPDPFQREKKKTKRVKKEQGSNKHQKQVNNTYQFDEEDEVEEEKDNKVIDINGRKRSKKDEFDKYHDQNQKSFIKLDSQLLFLMPFFISFIICNNIFAVDFISLGLITLMLVSYFVFNIKGKLNQVKLLQFLFFGFSLLGYFSYFYNDHDLTT